MACSRFCCVFMSLKFVNGTFELSNKMVEIVKVVATAVTATGSAYKKVRFMLHRFSLYHWLREIKAGKNSKKIPETIQRIREKKSYYYYYYYYMISTYEFICSKLSYLRVALYQLWASFVLPYFLPLDWREVLGL